MESPDLDDLYDDAILDHCRHPRNPDVLESPDISGKAVNPFCGDEVSLQVVLDGGRISRVGVQSVGCAINQASASMLSEAVEGKTIEEVGAMERTFRSTMRGEAPAERDTKQPRYLESLVEVRKYPVRIKCALLAWSALEDGIERASKEQGV